MPRGSAPGERRGGRQKGTPDNATLERQQRLDAILSSAATLMPESIDNFRSPKEYFDASWRVLAKAGMHAAARVVAEVAMPFLDAKLTAQTVDDKRRRSPTEFSDEELLALASQDLGDEGDGEAPLRPN